MECDKTSVNKYLRNQYRTVDDNNNCVTENGTVV